MPDSSEFDIPEPGAGEQDATQTPRPDRMRRLYRWLLLLAPLAIAVAVLVNWLWAEDLSRTAADAGISGVPGAGIPDAVVLEKPAVELLPRRILQFETMNRQGVPGMGERAGEALYKTLNMGVETQVDIVVYARAEGFASSADAQARLVEMMRPYSANRRTVLVEGVTRATVGEAPDKSAYTIAWVRGVYVTMVKASYEEWTPPDQIRLLKRQGDPVAEAVDVYQRTGREGVSK